MMLQLHRMMLATHRANHLIAFPLNVAVNMIRNKSIHNDKNLIRHYKDKEFKGKGASLIAVKI